MGGQGGKRNNMTNKEKVNEVFTVLAAALATVLFMAELVLIAIYTDNPF